MTSSGAGEKTPLLRDLEGARKAAPSTADQTRLFQMSRFLNANTPWYMLLFNIGMCFLNISTVAGAYFFILSNLHYTPKCYEYNDRLHLEILCNTTSFCFWTFPLLCMLVVVLVFAKNLFDTRLYYECMLHRCILDYENAQLTETPVLWLLLIYGLLALGTFGFVATRIDQESLSREIFGALAYFAPVISFAVVFTANWQIEANLIPLPKFCETDPTFASEVLKESTYVPEKHLRLAFEEVEEAYDHEDSPFDSGGYFGMLVHAAKIELENTREKAKQVPKNEWAWWERLLANRGLPPVDDYNTTHFGGLHSTEVMRRQDLLSAMHSIKNGGYWVHRLLHSRHLTDDRALNFRWWSKVYLCFVVLFVVWFLWTFTCTAVTFFTYQRLLSVDSTLSTTFRLPVNGDHLAQEGVFAAVTGDHAVLRDAHAALHDVHATLHASALNVLDVG